MVKRSKSGAGALPLLKMLKGRWTNFRTAQKTKGPWKGLKKVFFRCSRGCAVGHGILLFHILFSNG